MTTRKSEDSLNLSAVQLKNRADDIYGFFEQHKDFFIKIFTTKSFEDIKLMQEYVCDIQRNVERIYSDAEDVLDTELKNHAREIKDFQEQIKDFTKDKESLEDEVKELKNEVKVLESDCGDWETRYEEKCKVIEGLMNYKNKMIDNC